MFKKAIFVLTFLFMAVSMISCGGMNSETGNRASSGGAVSAQAVSGQAVSGQAVSGQTVNSQAVEEETVKDSDSETGDRIDRTVEPAMDVDKQIAVITSQKDVWNMGKHEEEPFPEAYYVSEFEYALTDLDQDGYFEILVYSSQGTGCFTDFAVYEVNESGNGIVKWDVKRDAYAEEEQIAPDFYEYPMEAYLDESTGSYHYSALDHVHASAVSGSDYIVDMAIINNTIQMHVVTYAAYEPDDEVESHDDLKIKTEYFDSEGKKISEKESQEQIDAYYQGMTERYMFYTPYDIKSEELEKADKEYLEDLTWDLENSWYYAFAIEEINRDSAFEASLSDDIRKQLKTLMSHKNGLGQYIDDKTTFVQYAVTDFDRDGRLELTVATIEGSGRFCYYSMYEVDESGKKTTKWKTKEGDSLADISNADKVVTYKDESSGVIYYQFEDFVRVSGDENYTFSRNLFVKENVVREDGKLKKNEKKNMKKGTQAFGWRNGRGYNISRMNSNFKYDELVASWKVFCGK